MIVRERAAVAISGVAAAVRVQRGPKRARRNLPVPHGPPQRFRGCPDRRGGRGPTGMYYNRITLSIHTSTVAHHIVSQRWQIWRFILAGRQFLNEKLYGFQVR